MSSKKILQCSESIHMERKMLVIKKKPFKQEHKVSYRCSLPSLLQKRSKDYKGLHRSPANFELLSFLRLWEAKKILAKVQENSEAQNLQNSFKNLYRGQLFNFCLRRFFSSKIRSWRCSLLLAMSI